MGYAIVTLSVQDIIKGNCPKEIKLKRNGVNDRYEYVDTEYAPVFFKNKRYIICLKKYPEGYYKNLGLYNGTYEIVDGIVNNSYIYLKYLKQSNKRRIKRDISTEDFKRLIKNILNSL